MNHTIKALYGLKFNPFAAELPVQALHRPPAFEDFAWRIENGIAQEGGFALITGEPGTGKSVALRLLAERLERLPEVTVACVEHPQSRLADFYREMGDLFGLTLQAHNRWGGFKSLREKWSAHIDATLTRPILLIDEAQEMPPMVLNELRILSASRLDSRIILGVILAGDLRLADKLRRDDLLPLGSRIRTRLRVDSASRDELQQLALHLMQAAGNPNLLTRPLLDTLCEHAMGNYRAMLTMANELLSAAAQRQLDVLDEQLFLDVFAINRNQTVPARTSHRDYAAH
jgi:type II secretory pathway predicted ATPase ExeA